MPPERLNGQKRREQTREREELAHRIFLSGIEMIPCWYCEHHGRKCVVGIGSKKCSECVCQGRTCDAETPSPSDWRSIELEEERLKNELLRVQQLAAEMSARAVRLQKQRDALQSKALRMMRLGLQTLDELDAQEEKEKEEKDKVVADARMQLAATTAAQSGGFPSLSSEELLAFESSLWGLTAGGGGMPPTSRGS
jgi:hypothetical protein